MSFERFPESGSSRLCGAAGACVTVHAFTSDEETAMADSDLTLQSVRAMAEAIGMTRLTDTHLEELRRATQSARARRSALPVERITPADEPAHVFRPGAEDAR